MFLAIRAARQRIRVLCPMSASVSSSAALTRLCHAAALSLHSLLMFGTGPQAARVASRPCDPALSDPPDHPRSDRRSPVRAPPPTQLPGRSDSTPARRARPSLGRRPARRSSRRVAAARAARSLSLARLRPAGVRAAAAAAAAAAGRIEAKTLGRWGIS